MIVRPKLNIEEVGKGILHAVLLSERKRTLTVMIEGGYKTDILKYPGNIKNYSKIDFFDRRGYQTFILSDWQIKNLVFYTGNRPTDQEVDEWRKGHVSEASYPMILKMHEMIDAYKIANGVYQSTIEKSENYTVETLGGYGNVAIDNLNMNTNLARIIKFWIAKKPLQAHFINKGTKFKPYMLALEFVADVEKDKWRLECVNPKIEAHRVFIDAMRSYGFKVNDLKIAVLDVDDLKSSTEKNDID